MGKKGIAEHPLYKVGKKHKSNEKNYNYMLFNDFLLGDTILWSNYIRYH
jgi:hypothetical protein